MGGTTCEIFYDNHNSTYYPNQTINGKVEINCNTEKKVRGVTIEFKGEAYVHWTEKKTRKGPNGKEEDYSETYNGHEEYFKMRYYLIGSNSGELILPTGKNEFPFTCHLPPVLPSSFEGEHGYVRYTVRIVLDRPWRPDKDFNFQFTVRSQCDLNFIPAAKDPISDEEVKIFGCCCCEQAPFTMQLNLPCSGFTPGQKIPITIECDNGSKTEIEHLRIRLERCEKYYSNQPHKETKTNYTELGLIRTERLMADENATYEESLIVPDTPPSELENCGIIDISYSLSIKAKVDSCCSNSPTLESKIFIGTIPLHDFVNQLGPCMYDKGQQPHGDMQNYYPGPTPLSPSGEIGWNANNVQVPYPPANNVIQNNVYPPTSYPSTTNDSHYQTTSYTPQTSYPSGGNTVPYPPGGNTTPYPSGGNSAPYPSGGNTALYPSGGNAVPYPSGGNAAPYPSGGNTASYPPGGNTAPYPPGGNTAPYPPGGNTAPYPPGGNTAPYPSGGNTAPYPPSGNTAPYPPGGNTAPYPPGENTTPYPPGGNSYNPMYQPAYNPNAPPLE